MNQIDGNDDIDWEDERDPDRADDDEWECEFGDKCLMPSFYHRRSECHTVEMAQAWRNEEAQKYFNLCPRCAAKWR